MNILSNIIKDTAERIAKAKLQHSLEQLKALAATSSFIPKNLRQQLILDESNNGVAVIAEIKFASPSKGQINAGNDPIKIALEYANNGASALSVLTEPNFFKGDLNYLKQVRAVTDLPLLRKDFIIDQYQIYQSLLAGADAILLIVSALSKQKLIELYKIAKSLNLSVLVEVHDKEEFSIAVDLGADLIGINNRNLHSFKTDIKTTLELAHLQTNQHLVTESGITMTSDFRALTAARVKSYLIGELFMKSQSPGEQLQQFLNKYKNASKD